MKYSFFCNTHNEDIKEKNEYLICKKCGKIAIKRNGLFDFFLNATHDSKVWDEVFESDIRKISFFKKIFDKLLWLFLPNLLNEFTINYIVKEYPENTDLIELGCGEGTVSRDLLKRKNYNIYLLDISDTALKNLNMHLIKEGIKDKCILLKDDFYNKELYFKKNFFDVSYNVGVIEHFDDPVKAVRKMKDISKRVICVVPAKSIYFKIGTIIRRIIEKDSSLWTQNTNYYSMSEVKQIFIQAGLINIQIKQITFLRLPFCIFATGE
jgi:SAM-dependent methyltransferase